MRKPLLFLLLFFAFKFSNSAIGPLLNWGMNIPANVGSLVKAMNTDASGNVYITGFYAGVNVDFEHGSGVTSLSSPGQGACFVAKYSSIGQLLWVKSIDGTSSIYVNGICLVNGNVWLAGYFTGTIDFDPSNSVVNSTSAGGQDAFVLKLDGATGNYLWRGVMGGPSIETAKSISQDELGRIILVGEFGGTVDFDPGVGTTNFTAAGGTDVWFVCLDNAGVLITAKRIGGGGNDVATAVKSKTSNGSPIAICGTFGGAVDFDWGVGTASKTSNGSLDAFVLVVNSLFQFQWVNTFGGASIYDNAETIEVDAANKIIVGGSLTDTADMDPSAGVSLIYSNPSSQSAFIAKYSATGVYEWAFALRSDVPFSNSVLSVCSDAANNVYATGYTSTVDVDPTPAQYTISSATNRSVFLLKYNSSGQLQWGSALPSYGDGNAIAVDALNHILVGGYFQGTIDINPSPINTPIVALGSGSNAILAQYGTCDYPTPLATVNDTVCQGSPLVYSATGTGVVSWYYNANDNGYLGESPVTLNIQTVGLHTYWVQDSTCGAGLRSSKTIYVAPNPTVTIAAPSHVCDGEVVHLTGFGAAIYDWNTMTSGQDAVDTPSVGTYTYYVVGTNTFGCRDTTSANVAVTSLPQPNLVSANSVACLGLGTQLFDADHSGVDYTWSTTQTGDTITVIPTQTTTYLVTVQDGNGCLGSDTIAIAVSSVNVTVTQSGNTLTVAEVGAAFYQWGNCITNTPIDSANDVSYTFTADGTYAVYVMNSFGCADTSACIAVTIPTGITSIDENQIQVSPNPFTGEISLQLTALSNTAFVEVYTAVGQLVKRETIFSTRQTLQLAECSSGIYVIQVRDGEKTYRQKVMKQ